MVEQRRSARLTIRWTFRVCLMSLVLLVLAGCGSGGESPDASATAAARLREGMEGLKGAIPVTVRMMDEQRFEPAALTVPVGTTVIWQNASTEEHTVTADPSQATTASNVQLPAGAEPFGSETVPQGQTFAQQFTVAGEYRYVCRIHEESGMVGSITVE